MTHIRILTNRLVNVLSVMVLLSRSRSVLNVSEGEVMDMNVNQVLECRMRVFLTVRRFKIEDDML